MLVVCEKVRSLFIIGIVGRRSVNVAARGEDSITGRACLSFMFC